MCPTPPKKKKKSKAVDGKNNLKKGLQVYCPKPCSGMSSRTMEVFQDLKHLPAR
jgi:hypothetical protein